jgi:hypothetical protein
VLSGHVVVRLARVGFAGREGIMSARFAAVLSSAAIGAIAVGVPALASTAVGFARGGVPGGYSLISTSTPPPPPAIPLTPNGQGYVRVETKSGSTGCSINTELVACQPAANNWPTTPGGQHYHTVSVTANGQLHWGEPISVRSRVT